MRVPHSNRSLIAVSQRYLSSIASSEIPNKLLNSSWSPTNCVSTMAGASENFASDDANFGFQRPEMFKSTLAGTVDPYGRHVFLCYKTHESWPSRVEDSDADLLPKLLSGALKARKDDITVKTRLTICEGRDGTELSDGDVLIFPEMIKYRGLKDSDVDDFVEDVLVNGKTWDSGVHEVLTGSHIFVCSHNSRDRRCGVCGPVLIEKFKEDIKSRGLEDQVFVTACSHVGGHKYAGNLIVFGADKEGKIAGHWFGYVTPNDVTELLDQHIGKGEIIERIWRGQMGASVEEAAKEEEEQKLPNGKDLEISKKPQERNNQEEKESIASCCQGSKGFSCCRDVSSDENEITEVQGMRGLGRLSSWIRKWEQADVLAAGAAVGAVAVVAAAFSLYRRSR